MRVHPVFAIVLNVSLSEMAAIKSKVQQSNGEGRPYFQNGK